MANESTQVEGPYEAHDFTVADGASIPIGTLCQLTDPRTCSLSSGADVFAGVAATEKVASNGVTNLGLWTTGTFVMTAVAGATIAIGDLVSLSGANLIKLATAGEVVLGQIVGKAMEAIASTTTGEVKLVAN